MPSIPITTEKTKQWKTKFYNRSTNQVALNNCAKSGPFAVSQSRKESERIHHIYSIKISPEGYPVTDQTESGRCWLFAALNIIRIPFMKYYGLNNFEFSQNYLFFWDKIERSNYFLHTIVDVLKRKEKIDGRLMNTLLKDPVNDGGQWDMVANLITKYGLIPKTNFPETFSSRRSYGMNILLQNKLREFAKYLVDMYESQSNPDEYNYDELYERIDEQMCDIYKIVGICLSIPPDNFIWEYYNKNGEYENVGPITPLYFYNDYVKKFFDIENKVCLINDPRPSSQYGRTYTIDCLNNVVNGRPIIYNNQKMEILIDLVAKSIKNGDAVWFGADISQFYNDSFGACDLEIFDFTVTFGFNFLGLDRADRILYGESVMNHAMVFTGVSFDEKNEPCKFRVENSWSAAKGHNGYLLMTVDWFKEFVYEIVVDKSILSEDILKTFKKKPRVLPLWDPFGTLAQ